MGLAEVFRSDQGVGFVGIDEAVKSVGSDDLGMNVVCEQVDAVVLPSRYQAVWPAVCKTEVVHLAHIEALC